MSIFDDIKIYLPKYLTPESQRELFEELKNFPYNIDKRFYSNFSLTNSEIFQGDGLRDIFISNISEQKFIKVNVLVISNSCDINKENDRFFPINMTYCPIVKLSNYEEYLKKSKFDKEKIQNHLNAIKKQEYTSLFYLPQNNDLEQESIAFLDRINNIEVNSLDYDNVCKNKLFSLSLYAFYLFLVKLSIHFSRMAERINRNESDNDNIGIS